MISVEVIIADSDDRTVVVQLTLRDDSGTGIHSFDVMDREHGLLVHRDVPDCPPAWGEQLDRIEVGTQVLIVGFPLGFHDTLHHLPVARQAVIASAFGIRFQGQGYFLTDGQLHRGTSGAPVVSRVTAQRSGRGDLPWMLLGVHAARMDVAGRDIEQDERLNLNCAWYADALLKLTQH